MKPFKALTLSVVFIMLFTAVSISQNNVGIGTTTPNASALLDLNSSSMGILIPRVSLLAVGNSTSPVNSPATGLLVYNTGGALAAGFWYWNGSLWTQIGAGGGSCSTLDQAYDCGGAGTGRLITADAGAVEITMPLSATNNDGLISTSNKGTLAVPATPIYAVNNQHGTALFVETTLGANLYGGIQSSANITNANAAYMPAAISGYKFGNGIGAGVYGEAIGTGASAGVAVTGYATHNNFGGDFYSTAFVGLQCEVGTNNQALQVVANGANPLNPAVLTYGWAQFRCSNDATGHSVLANNLALEATFAPSAGSYGFLGTASVAWWYLYYYNATAVSRRETKRDITYIEGDLEEYVMNDIDQIKPTFYKFKVEEDEYREGNEPKTRYNMHMGLILDETPDYIQDNAFSGIDVYALSTLAITGVKYNRNHILILEEEVALMKLLVQDFGTSKLTGNSVRVNYGKDFKGEIPVVTITPVGQPADYYISEQDETGFTLAVNNTSEFQFNWMAMAECEAPVKSDPEQLQIDAQLLSQLRVDESKKMQLYHWAMSLTQENMELMGRDTERAKPLKYK